MISNNTYTNLLKFKKKELKMYYMLDRKPISFEKEKHIDNIVSIFIDFLKVPYEIKTNIAKFIFDYSKDANLKILNHLIINKEKEKLINFNLLDNSVCYIRTFLYKCYYNLILYDTRNKLEISNIKKIYKNEKYIENKLKYLIIITDPSENYHYITPNNDIKKYCYDDSIKTNTLETIIGNKDIILYENNEKIETSLDIEKFTFVDIKCLRNNYICELEKNNPDNVYNLINKYTKIKLCIKILNIINDKSHIESFRYYKNKLLYNEYISIKDFSYLLMRYILPGNFVIIIINKQYIIFNGEPIGDGCLNGEYFSNFSIFEIKKDGTIIVPNYTVDEIDENMNLINIHDFINYNIFILNK